MLEPYLAACAPARLWWGEGYAPSKMMILQRAAVAHLDCLEPAIKIVICR
jgi:hypothetical protein